MDFFGISELREEIKSDCPSRLRYEKTVTFFMVVDPGRGLEHDQ
jgi:hypothetical protein